MKKIKVSLFVLVLIMIVSTAVYYLYPITILDSLKLKRAVGGEHHLIFDNQKLGYISGLDSWYVEGSQVYGSMSSNRDRTNTSLFYFYVDVCTGENLVIASYSRFEDFLDNEGISKERRNYMSGNNLINMSKFAYSSSVDCS